MPGMGQELGEMMGLPRQRAAELDQRQSAESLFGPNMSQTIERSMSAHMRGRRYENQQADRPQQVEQPVDNAARQRDDNQMGG